MFAVPLSNAPNQQCSLRLEGALFELTLKTARACMLISISRDGVTLVQGQRCLPGRPLIPYRYLEGLTGNFYFVNNDGQYPHYSRFGGADALLYLTAAELGEARNG